MLKSLGIEFDVHYTVVPYMVTSKLFLPMHKKVDFPIIAFSELESILRKENILT